LGSSGATARRLMHPGIAACCLGLDSGVFIVEARQANLSSKVTSSVAA